MVAAPPGHMDALQKAMVDAAQAAVQLCTVLRQLSPAATDMAASIAQACPRALCRLVALF